MNRDVAGFIDEKGGAANFVTDVIAGAVERSKSNWPGERNVRVQCSRGLWSENFSFPLINSDAVAERHQAVIKKALGRYNSTGERKTRLYVFL